MKIQICSRKVGAAAVAVAVLASLGVAGCGKDKVNDPVKNVRVASEDRDIQNKNFVSGCSLRPIDAIMTGILTAGQASLKAATITYRFEGANVTRTVQVYPTTDCTGDAALSIEESGEMKLNTDARTGEGAKFVDFDFKTLKASAVSDVGVVAANAVGLCSAKDWALKQQRDVTAHAAERVCYGVALPRHQSNIYRLDSNTLYFGTQSSDAVDAAKRPTQLNMADGYVGH